MQWIMNDFSSNLKLSLDKNKGVQLISLLYNSGDYPFDWYKYHLNKLVDNFMSLYYSGLRDCTA